jgi:hypothetical protein
MSAAHNRNPKGKNQHGDVRKWCSIHILQQLSSTILAGVDDADFAKKLTDLYREGLSDKKIAERMQVEGIKIR